MSLTSLTRRRLGGHLARLAGLAGVAALAATLALPVHAADAAKAADSATAAPRVKFVTSAGDFVIEVYPDKAPKTVENFLQYVNDKFYDGTVFHRVISGFMIQGGGFDKDYNQKATRMPVKHEGRESVAKGLRNTVGMVSMARTGDPHSATAQFFINTANNERLDPIVIPEGDPVKEITIHGQTYTNVPRARLTHNLNLFGYTVFGKVVEGMDTVQKIERARTGPGGRFPTDVPQTQIVIESARVLK